MKKFLALLAFFIGIPLALCIVVYAIGCFMTWSILKVDIVWPIVRLYVVVACILSFFMTLDKDL